MFLTFFKQVRLLRYSKVSTPALNYSTHPKKLNVKLISLVWKRISKYSIYLLKMYFLYWTGTLRSFIFRESSVKISLMCSNLSAISSQSPPIDLQNFSGVKSDGIFRSNPGGGIGLTTLYLSLGVLNLNPLSVFPVNDIVYIGSKNCGRISKALLYYYNVRLNIFIY